MDVRELDGRAYAKFVAAGAYFLRKYRGVLNDLNVFPVPDGDTGTNMYLTARQAAIAAGKVRNRPLSEVAAAASTGALMGARGNSGVIISQMLRGFAHHVRDRGTIDTLTLACGMREAVAAAKRALVKPVDGTIISVAEAAADAAYRQAQDEPDFYRFLDAVLRSANDAVDRTPDQLPLLKEAGVVDSGAAGFVYFLEGGLRFLPDAKAPATAFPRRAVRARVFTPAQAVGERKYCTEFILESARCGADELREELLPHGESLIVAGEPPTIKVHLHTDDPQAIRNMAAARGEVTRWKVDDMEQQHELLLVDATAPYSVAFVAPGPGFEQIARELGADVTIPAPNNPSVRDLLLGINACVARRVYLFVNDKNVALAAAQAAELSARDVRVLPTADIVHGLAGLLYLRQPHNEAPNELDVLQQAAATKSAQVFYAGKDAQVGGVSVERGSPAARHGGALFTGESLAAAACAALTSMDVRDGALITAYYGGSQTQADAQTVIEALRTAFPQADAEYAYGGQKNAEYWISLDE